LSLAHIEKQSKDEDETVRLWEEIGERFIETLGDTYDQWQACLVPNLHAYPRKERVRPSR
jgi:hypothetical protein